MLYPFNYFFNFVVSTAYFNARCGQLTNHAHNKYVAMSNLAKGAFFSLSWIYAQWSLTEAGLLIRKASPIASAVLCRAGLMSWVWLTPLALAILVSLRGLGDWYGNSNPTTYARYAWIEDNMIRLVPGSSQLIQLMLFATKPIAQIAITVSTLAVAYFTGGYFNMVLAAYTVFDSLCKMQLLSEPLQNIDARINQGFFGLAMLDSFSYEVSFTGITLVYKAIFDTKIAPLIGFDSYLSFGRVNLTERNTLPLYSQERIITDTDMRQFTVTPAHMRPASLPTALGNIQFGQINFNDQVNSIWQEMERSLEPQIVKQEIYNERATYDRWRNDREDSFELQKEFLRAGHRLCIETLRAQSLAGDSRQEDLAKAAAAAVQRGTGREKHLAQHSFLVTLGVVGHFCHTRKGAGIDSLAAGYLAENADQLSTKVEGILRDLRSQLFQEYFIAKLLAEHPQEFGPNGPCDLRNVHYQYALVYIAGLRLGLHEHWGAYNEVQQFGSDTVRAVKAVYDRVQVSDAAQQAFRTAYSREAIIEAVQQSIASTANGTLKYLEVEAWFVDWLITKNVVQIENHDRAYIESVSQVIAGHAQDSLDADTLGTRINPNCRFALALATEYLAGNAPDYERAYLKEKAKEHFQTNGYDPNDNHVMSNWIATMLAEMGVLAPI